MRAVIQRVKSATITIDGDETREIGMGLLVYLCVMENDTEKETIYLKNKISSLRIFSDENDKLNLSLKDIGGDMLIVSNFTLSANCRKGNRPSFELAEKPLKAKQMYENFISLIKEDFSNVVTGEFGADMDIESIATGPVNLIMDTDIISK